MDSWPCSVHLKTQVVGCLSLQRNRKVLFWSSSGNVMFQQQKSRFYSKQWKALKHFSQTHQWIFFSTHIHQQLCASMLVKQTVTQDSFCTVCHLLKTHHSFIHSAGRLAVSQGERNGREFVPTCVPPIQSSTLWARRASC